MIKCTSFTMNWTCKELGNGSTTIGFAFVDCAALKVWVGSVEDDASCAALEALLMQVRHLKI